MIVRAPEASDLLKLLNKDQRGLHDFWNNLYDCDVSKMLFDIVDVCRIFPPQNIRVQNEDIHGRPRNLFSKLTETSDERPTQYCCMDRMRDSVGPPMVCVRMHLPHA